MSGGALFMLFVCLASVAAAQVPGRPVISPTEVSLAAPVRSTTPATTTLSVFVNGGQALPFTASVRYIGATTGWLTVTPAAGDTPGTITLRAVAGSLPVGTYSAQVVVNIGPSAVVAQVLFNVTSTGGSGSTLRADPPALTFLGEPGGTLLPGQSIGVTSATADPVTFRAFATSDQNWLTVLAPFPLTTPASVPVLVSQTGLEAKTYRGTVTLVPVSGGEPTIIPVVLASGGSATAAEELRLSQTTVTITHPLGSTATAEQQVTVTPSNSAFEYTASTSTPWIRLRTYYGGSAAQLVTGYGSIDPLFISADATGMSVGSYSGTVTVGSTGLPEVSLPVQLVVTSVPTLVANPSSVFLRDVLQLDAAVQVTVTGGAAAQFTATTTAPWLVVAPASGNIPAGGGAQPLTLTANTTGLQMGPYNAVVTLTSQTTGVTGTGIPVRLQVYSSTASEVSLTTATETVELTGLAGGPPVSSAISIGTSAEGGELEFTAAATSTGGWLRVSPFNGVAPQRITITADPAAVAGAGDYTGSVTLTALGTAVQTTIPVTFKVLGTGITASVQTLQFNSTGRGAAVEPQTVQLTSNTFSTYNVANVPDWLRVDPVFGTTPATLTLRVDATKLDVGTKTATLRIIGPNNAIELPVSVTVPEPPPPTATPAALTIAYLSGAPAPTREVVIGDSGEKITFTVAATTESGKNWLSVTPTSGTTPATLMVAVNPLLITPGEQKGTITITPTSGTKAPQTIPVTVTFGLSPVSIETISHGASLSPTPLAPGMFVTITGTGLSSAASVTARPTAAGAYETRLGDARVLFDGVAAPMLYASFNEVRAIVPYAVYGRVSTRVQVELGTNYSLPIEAKIVDSAPGIFTAAPGGRGQASAVNADGTANALANPAERGSVITIFATGEGQTNPGGRDGRIIETDLRRPILPVTARIGGRTAEVVYAGSAPMQVAGTFQVNVRVPADAPTGAVPIEIQVGTAPSQSGVTVAIR